jgi:hypothetical protein
VWHPHRRDSTPLGAPGPRVRSGEDDFAADGGLAEHPDDGPGAFGLVLVAHELGDLPVPAGELDAFGMAICGAMSSENTWGWRSPCMVSSAANIGYRTFSWGNLGLRLKHC